MPKPEDGVTLLVDSVDIERQGEANFQLDEAIESVVLAAGILRSLRRATDPDAADLHWSDVAVEVDHFLHHLNMVSAALRQFGGYDAEFAPTFKIDPVVVERDPY